MRAIPSGRYIAAISGGVDSMALLAALCTQPHLKIIVAHVNHGIRSDATEDENVVRAFCKSHNLEFISKVLHLAANVSEAEARNARYDFLRKCRTKYDASAIITAHHQDDLIETAVLNAWRGTGWRGLAPFTIQSDIMRPLVILPKQALVEYATTHCVPWREDSTNSNQTYLRNYLRRTVLPMFDGINPQWRPIFLRYIRKQQLLRRKIDDELANALTSTATFANGAACMQRHTLIMLPEPLAYELLQAACKQLTGNTILREQAENAVLFAKVARAGKKMPLGTNWQVRVTRTSLFVEPCRYVLQ